MFTLANLHQRLQPFIMDALHGRAGVWYSLQHAGAEKVEGDVDELNFTDTIADIVMTKPQDADVRHDSDNMVTLLMHPPRSVIEVYVTYIPSPVDCKGDQVTDTIKVKVKPSQRCAMMMQTASQYFRISSSNVSFSINGRQLSASESFLEGGVTHHSELIVTSLTQ